MRLNACSDRRRRRPNGGFLMSDDSFIREVNEEIRQDRAKALWDRYGPAAIVVAVLVVLATAAWVGYDYWRESRASRSGDAFAQALQLARDGKSDEALKALEAIETEGHGAYPRAGPDARRDRAGRQGRLHRRRRRLRRGGQ